MVTVCMMAACIMMACKLVICIMVAWSTGYSDKSRGLVPTNDATSRQTFHLFAIMNLNPTFSTA